MFMFKCYVKVYKIISFKLLRETVFYEKSEHSAKIRASQFGNGNSSGWVVYGTDDGDIQATFTNDGVTTMKVEPIKG